MEGQGWGGEVERCGREYVVWRDAGRGLRDGGQSAGHGQQAGGLGGLTGRFRLKSGDRR